MTLYGLSMQVFYIVSYAYTVAQIDKFWVSKLYFITMFDNTYSSDNNSFNLVQQKKQYTYIYIYTQYNIENRSIELNFEN